MLENFHRRMFVAPSAMEQRIGDNCVRLFLSSFYGVLKLGIFLSPVVHLRLRNLEALSESLIICAKKTELECKINELGSVFTRATAFHSHFSKPTGR